jgi:hypothetical protein
VSPWVQAANEDRLSCAGKSRGVPLKVVDFVGSVARLAWAKVNGCPWQEITRVRGTPGVTVCAYIAKVGRRSLECGACTHGIRRRWRV